jgi:hypothetical protein
MLCSPKTLLAAAVTLLLLLSAALRAEDWPQWRGPNRDSVWGETGILQSFPQKGLNVRWRAPVGWGFSSPVVAHGRVYLADSELVKPKAKERLHCFDETTGKAFWELIRAQLTSQGYKEIGRVVVLEPTFPFGGRNVAWSAPAYANRHIFARNGKELICASLAAKP